MPVYLKTRVRLNSLMLHTVDFGSHSSGNQSFVKTHLGVIYWLRLLLTNGDETIWVVSPHSPVVRHFTVSLVKLCLSLLVADCFVLYGMILSFNSWIYLRPEVFVKANAIPLGLDRPLGLREVEAPRICIQLAHEGGKVVIPTQRPFLPLGNISLMLFYRGADRYLARPGRKHATATEDFEFHISYL